MCSMKWVPASTHMRHEHISRSPTPSRTVTFAANNPESGITCWHTYRCAAFVQVAFQTNSGVAQQSPAVVSRMQCPRCWRGSYEARSCAHHSGGDIYGDLRCCSNGFFRGHTLYETEQIRGYAPLPPELNSRLSVCLHVIARGK